MSRVQVLVFLYIPGVSFRIRPSICSNNVGGISDLADRDGDLQDVAVYLIKERWFLGSLEVDDGLDP